MNWLGRVLYRITVPFIHKTPGWKSKRVRVVIQDQQGQVLLIKSWLSRQQWTLPGGGIERGETPEVACVREIDEETGLKIHHNDLRYLATVYNERLRADLLMYSVPVSDSTLSKLKFPYQLEIIQRQWFDVHALPHDASQQTRNAIQLALTDKK